MSGSDRIDFLGQDPLGTATRLAELAKDLRLLAAGLPPSREMLLEAPMLRAWGFARMEHLALAGRIYGHPTVTEGHAAHTSPLFAIDRRRGWARTLSRYYALGPAGKFGGRA